MKLYFNRIKKLTLDNLIYICWSVYIFASFLNIVGIFFASENCQLLLKIVRYVCYIIFSIKIFYDWKKGEKITISILISTLVTIAIAFFAKNRSAFFILLILVALRKMEFDKLIKIAFKIFMVSFLVIISLAMLGIIPNWQFSRGMTPRYSLGFIYATDAIGMYLVIILMFFYTKKSNSTKTELLILEVINVFMYSYTNGRVSFILISTILFLQFLSRFQFIKDIFYNNFVQKCLKIICHTLPVILFMGLHLIVVMYASNNLVANKVNKILSNRVKLTYQAYRNYDMKLFGEKINWNGWGGYGYKEQNNDQDFTYNFLDSSYASIVFDYGLILSCMVILGYRKILITNYKDKNYWLVITIIFVLLWSFIEQHIINLGKNVFVLTFIPLLELGPINRLSYNNIKLKTNNKYFSR